MMNSTLNPGLTDDGAYARQMFHYPKEHIRIPLMTKVSYHKLVYKTVTGFIEINTNRKSHRFSILTNE